MASKDDLIYQLEQMLRYAETDDERKAMKAAVQYAYETPVPLSQDLEAAVARILGWPMDRVERAFSAKPPNMRIRMRRPE